MQHLVNFVFLPWDLCIVVHYLSILLVEADLVAVIVIFHSLDEIDVLCLCLDELLVADGIVKRLRWNHVAFPTSLYVPYIRNFWCYFR